MKKRLLIVDSHALIHRAYHALPKLTTKKGELVNAVYGFLLVFFRAIKDLKPDYIAACFDLPTPTFRHKEFKDYKSQRVKTPDDLATQIPKVKKVLKAFSVPIFEKEGFEADDLIGTLASRAAEIGPIGPTPHQFCKDLLRRRPLPRNRYSRPAVARTKDGKIGAGHIETIILSGDLDLLQLVDENIKVYALRRGVKDAILYDKQKILERYGLSPAQLPDYKALVGDPSDNIPGVPGIGPKTASKLLQEFGSLEKIYERLAIGNQQLAIGEKLKENLIKYKEQAFFSKKLAKLRIDVPLELDLKKCELRYDKRRVVAVLKEFGFESLMTRLPRPTSPSAQSKAGGPSPGAKATGGQERLPKKDCPEEKRGSGRLFDL